MIYEKQTSVTGGWLKGADVVSGTKAKLVSECVATESVYEGKPRTQNVAKIRLQGDDGEPKNININKPSINALIEAFGKDSNDWCNKTLTIQTEKVVIAGKRVTAMYLVPEGFEVTEDAGGYIQIAPVGKTVEVDEAPELTDADVPQGW